MNGTISALDAFCKEVVEGVEGVIALGVVGLRSKMLIGSYHTVPYFDAAYLDDMAALAVKLFRGLDVLRIERRMTKAKGDAVKNSIESIYMTTTNSRHFLAADDARDILIVLVMERQSSFGLGLSHFNNVVPRIVDLLDA